MDDVITIATELSTKGFEKGSKELKRAVQSLSQSVKKMGTSMISALKRVSTLIIGVGSAYGILSKAVNSYMQENEKLSQRMTAIWTALGNVIGPIIERVIDWVSTAVSYFLEFLRLLGVTNKSASELSKKAKKNTEDLRRTIAGFDELNVLNKPNENKENPLEDKELPDWMKELVELLKGKEWDKIADLIIEGLNNAISKFKVNAERWGQEIGEYLRGIIHVAARVLDETDWHGLGEGLANFLKGLIPPGTGRQLGEDIGKMLVAPFTIGFKILTGFLENFDSTEIGRLITGIFMGAINSVTKAIEQADPEKIGKNLANMINNIDFKEIASAFANLINTAFDFALSLVYTFITETDFGRIGEAIGTLFGEIDWMYISEELLAVLKAAWNGAVEFLLGFLNNPQTAEGFYNLGKAIRNFFSGIDWDKVKKDLHKIFQGIWDDAMAFLRGLMGADQGEDPPLIKKLEKIKTIVEEKLIPAIDKFKDKAWPKIKEALEWTIDKGLPQMLEDVADLIDDLSRVIGDGDWKGFVENFNALEGALLALGGVKVLTGLADMREHISRILQLFGVGGAAGGAGGVAGAGGAAGGGGGLFSGIITFARDAAAAVGLGAEALGGMTVAASGTTIAAGALTATGVGLIAALGLVPAIMYDNKKSTEYAKKAFEDTDGSVEGLAKKMDELSETASHYDECIYDTTGYTQEYGWSAQESAWAAKAYDEMLEKLSDTLGISQDELKKLIECCDGNVTKAVELYQATGSLEGAQEQLAKSSDDVSDAMEKTENKTKEAGAAVEKAAETHKKAFDKIKEKAKEIASEMKDKMDSMKRSVEESANKTRDSISKMKEKITSDFSVIKTKIGDSAKNMSEKMANGMNSMKTKTENVVTRIKDYMGNTFTNLASRAYSWGSHLISQFGSGISSRLSSLLSHVRSVASSIRSYLHFSEPDVGPLSDFNSYAPDMMKTFAEGIEKNKGVVIDAVKSMSSGLNSEFNSMSNGMKLNEKIAQLGNVANVANYGKSGVIGGYVVPYSVGNYGSNEMNIADVARELKQAMEDAINATTAMVMENNRVPININLNVDGKTFYRLTYNDLEDVKREHGTSLISNFSKG